MVETIKNTATDYEHMLDFVAEENINKGSLQEFIGEKEEYKPEVRVQTKDADFPEEWQHLYVNFKCLEDYAMFMEKIENKPGPKIKKLIYERPGTTQNIYSFIDDDNE
jgi:hypothetical protein